MSNTEIIAAKLSDVLNKQDRIAAADLYGLVEDELEPALELADFRLLVSKCVHERSAGFKEFEIRKGRYGGIRKKNAFNAVKESDSDVSDDENEETDCGSDEVFEGPAPIMINHSTRIHAVDKRNWAIQKLSGELWMSHHYYPRLSDALDGTARMILNNELRMSLNKTMELKEMSEFLSGLEKKIAEKIEKSRL